MPSRRVMCALPGLDMWTPAATGSPENATGDAGLIDSRPGHVAATAAAIMAGAVVAGVRRRAEVHHRERLPLRRQGVEGPIYTNPVCEQPLGDPFVLKHNGCWYAYGTQPDGPPGVPAFHSHDLVHWEPLGLVLTAPDAA